MNINIKDILKENGYEIVGQIRMKYFRLKYTKEELERKMEIKELFEHDLEGEFNVKISEMGFNGDGNLYIVLTCMDDEHFEEGDTFDVIGDEDREDAKSNM